MAKSSVVVRLRNTWPAPQTRPSVRGGVWGRRGLAVAGWGQAHGCWQGQKPSRASSRTGGGGKDVP